MPPRNRPAENSEPGSFLNIFRGRTPLIFAALLMITACKGEGNKEKAKDDVVTKAIQSILDKKGENNKYYWQAAMSNCMYPPRWDPSRDVADVAFDFSLGDMIENACSKALGDEHNSKRKMEKCLRAVTTREALCSQMLKKAEE